MIPALLIFQALAEPTRLRILRLLQEMELSVGELAQLLGQSQPRVSRHVKILAEAGLVERRKEGSWVFLTLGEKSVLAPVFAALEQWGDPPECQTDRKRLQAIRLLRVDEAHGWFEEHATEWDAIRSLHVAEKEVEEAIAATLLASATGKRSGRESLGRFVDIGTGTGRMLQLFASQAEAATGFDRSPAMLRLARSKLGGQKTASGQRIELCQGDFYALPMEENAADHAVMHQVLHYAQHPTAVLAEASRILAENGRLLVVDFARHGREDLRLRDAHSQLGFTDDEMQSWFAQASLRLESSRALPPPEDGNNALTVKLWTGRKERC